MDWPPPEGFSLNRPACLAPALSPSPWWHPPPDTRDTSPFLRDIEPTHLPPSLNPKTTGPASTLQPSLIPCTAVAKEARDLRLPASATPRESRMDHAPNTVQSWGKAMQVPPRVLEEWFMIPWYFWMHQLLHWLWYQYQQQRKKKQMGKTVTKKMLLGGLSVVVHETSGMSEWGYSRAGWEKGPWIVYRGTPAWHLRCLPQISAYPCRPKKLGLAFLVAEPDKKKSEDKRKKIF